MVNSQKYLFIEGAKDTTNGDLRQGFGILLEKKLKGKMPRIIMGEGKNNTIDKFKSRNNSYVLCDLDAPENERQNDIKKNNLSSQSDFVFYMIQEMEAWFLSQPDSLNEFYNYDFDNKIPKKHASEFSEPDKFLQNITKETKKGTYHKIKHGYLLLQKLDADKLCKDFPDFQNLIQKIEAKNSNN